MRLIRRLQTRLGDDSGFSLIEVTVAMVLSSMIAASLVTVFYALAQNTGDLSGRGRVQADSRAVIASQVVEIRQAIRADLNGEAIEALDPGRLAFYTQNYVSEEIERVIYERKECVADECELWVYKYALDEIVGGIATFEATPYASNFLMGKVLSDQPLFVGIEISGDPLVKSEISTCDGGAIKCNFSVVGITLRARPYPTTGGALTPIELHEEVRVRSA
ncbi:MAG: prepilin-type N-terminal cleavage/methylation domain-containing protein [Acidimicrobiia bacterium]